MSCSFEPLTFPTALYVAMHMRESDRREIWACRWSDSPLELARDSMAVGAFSWCGFYKGAPTVILGAYPLRPGVWEMWLYATDDFRKMRFSLVRWLQRVMIPAMVEMGCHRAEARAIEDHHDAHALMEHFGARREGVHEGFGKNGETFVTYALVWPVGRQSPERQVGGDRS